MKCFLTECDTYIILQFPTLILMKCIALKYFWVKLFINSVLHKLLNKPVYETGLNIATQSIVKFGIMETKYQF